MQRKTKITIGIVVGGVMALGVIGLISIVGTAVFLPLFFQAATSHEDLTGEVQAYMSQNYPEYEISSSCHYSNSAGRSHQRGVITNDDGEKKLFFFGEPNVGFMDEPTDGLLRDVVSVGDKERQVIIVSENYYEFQRYFDTYKCKR